MAISRLQSAYSYPYAAVTLTMTAGSLVWAWMSGNSTCASSTVGGGGTWAQGTSVLDSTNGTPCSACAAYTLSVTGGSQTFSITSGPADAGWSVHEYSWGGSTGTFDQESIRAQGATANPSAAAVTPGANGAVLIAGFSDEGTSTAPTWGSGFSAVTTDTGGHFHWTAELIQTPAANVGATTTRASANNGVVVGFMVFLPAGGGGLTAAQTIGIFDQQLSGSIIGRVDA